MSMRYDDHRKRIICRWEEPVSIVMNKKKGLIKRSRMITVKVNENGKLNSKDIRRHEKHPMFPYISRFNAMLNKIWNRSDADTEYRCAVCGMEDGVSPHFDTHAKGVVWLCREHLDALPQKKR